mmetsp:Transcript_37374/g.94278  ORF Transcript_37374/g.94278 Transcript_37374/m.94278 type:complete len:213 (+) Transcript_37374:967-1605(+)
MSCRRSTAWSRTAAAPPWACPPAWRGLRTWRATSASSACRRRATPRRCHAATCACATAAPARSRRRPTSAPSAAMRSRRCCTSRSTRARPRRLPSPRLPAEVMVRKHLNELKAGCTIAQQLAASPMCSSCCLVDLLHKCSWHAGYPLTILHKQAAAVSDVHNVKVSSCHAFGVASRRGVKPKAIQGGVVLELTNCCCSRGAFRELLVTQLLL